MSEAYGLRDLGESAEVTARAAKPGIRGRRGLRIALLSLAATILLLGAAIAGIFGYRAMNSGQSASAALHLQRAPGNSAPVSLDADDPAGLRGLSLTRRGVRSGRCSARHPRHAASNCGRGQDAW